MNIPPELIPVIITAIIEFSKEMVHEIGKKGVADQIDAIQDNKTFLNEIEIATHSALQRWIDEYPDRELAALFAKNSNLLTEPIVLNAIQAVARDPFSPVLTDTLHGKFKNLLPNILDETRLERGIAALLEYLREEFITVQAVREIHNAAANLQTARNTQELPEQTKLLKSIEEKLGKIASPPTPTDQTRQEYLRWVVNQNRYLDPRGVMQTVRQVQVKLEEIYVSLEAEREPELSASDRRIFESEIEELLMRKDLSKEQKEDFRENMLAKHLPKTGRQTGQPVELAKLVRENKKLVLLGDPGAGKTTLLRWLALRHAQALRSGTTQMEDLEKTRFPVYLRIATYAEHGNNRSLVEFLPKCARGNEDCQPKLERLVQQELKQGNCLILLDGLDEVIKLEQRAEIARQIDNLIAHHEQSGNHFVITSRVAGYRHSPLAGDIPHYHVRDMNEEQIQCFLQCWCPAVELSLSPDLPEEARQEKANGEIIDILTSISVNPGVRQLATNPLLLRILALIHRNGSHLPQRRVELYKLAAETLIRDWELGRGIQQVDLVNESEATRILAELAAWMHAEKPAGIAYEGDVKRRLAEAKSNITGLDPDNPEIQTAVEDFLSRIRQHTGLFVERAPRRYGFMHLTFEEYFAARWLVSKRKLAAKRIRAKLHQPRWEEPILLAIAFVGMDTPDDVDDLFREALLGDGLGGPSPYENVLHRDLLFATCALADQDVNSSLRQKLIAEFCHIYLDPKLGRKYDPLKAQMDAIIPTLHSSPAGIALIQQMLTFLKDKDKNIRAGAAEALQNDANHPEVISALLVALQDPNKDVRARAAEALEHSTEHCQVIPALLAALKDPSSTVRASAVYALKSATDNPVVISALLITLQDKDPEIRSDSAYALQNATKNHEVISALLTTLKNPNAYVRASAIVALQNATDNPEVLFGILSTLQDSYVDINFRISLALRNTTDNPKVIPVLLNFLKDSSANVRAHAAFVLQNFTDHPDVVLALLNTLEDKNIQVCVSAANALQTATNKPEVISALLSMLQNPNPHLSVSAANALQPATNKPEVISALLSIIHNPNIYVRGSAIQALKNATDSPEVISALLNALSDPDGFVRFSATEALQSATEHPKVVTVLLSALQDEDPGVCANAASALHNAINHPQVIPALLTALQNKNEDVRVNAAASLASIAQHPGVDHPANFADQLFQALSLPNLDGKDFYPKPSDSLLSALLAIAPGPQVPEE